MPAKTKWWLCGACSFTNKPRGQRANSLGLSGSDGLHDNDKCEQCGASRDHVDAVDYLPGGAR